MQIVENKKYINKKITSSNKMVTKHLKEEKSKIEENNRSLIMQNG